jgi:hypothetical protein
LWRVGDPAPTLVPQPVTAPAVPRFLSAAEADRELGTDDIWLPPLDPAPAVSVMNVWIVSTAMREATSPATCPPMPPATTKRPRSARVQ